MKQANRKAMDMSIPDSTISAGCPGCGARSRLRQDGSLICVACGNGYEPDKDDEQDKQAWDMKVKWKKETRCGTKPPRGEPARPRRGELD